MPSLNVAILTVSDTRDESNDTSGDLLDECAKQDGHEVYARDLVKDDIYQIRAVISQWIANPNVDVVVSTGGTGFGGRDSTPEALIPLFDKHIEGFGELFRWVSYEEIGTSTVQSRALAGIANGTIIFAVPGSTGACRTAWERILHEQLKSTHRPCNFAELIPKFRAKQAVG